MKEDDFRKLQVGDEVVWYRRTFRLASKVMQPETRDFSTPDWGYSWELFQLPRDRDELLAALDKDIETLQQNKEKVLSSARIREAQERDPDPLRL